MLRASDGKTLASGDLIQTVHGDRVLSHLVFQFKDGSVDDETSIFTQHDSFHLLTDHHIQKGPSFPHPVDASIDRQTGQVTVRFRNKGETKVEAQHFDFSPDLANGIILNVLKNIRPETPETKLSYIAADPRPRSVRLSIAPQGDEMFSVVGTPYKATRFLVKVELGGLAGFIAPLLGKEPPDVHVWILGGDAPAFVKLEGPLYLGGPVWNIEMTSPSWTFSQHTRP